MFDLYDNDFEKAFDEAVDAIERKASEKKHGRLIDADKLKAHYSWWEGGTREMTMDEAKNDFDTIIDLQPTVEAEPNTAIETVDWYHQNADGEMVLGANSNHQAWFKADDVFKALKAEPTKHGRWIKHNHYVECSICYRKWNSDYNDAYAFKYCPKCGARMDGGENG